MIRPLLSISLVTLLLGSQAVAGIYSGPTDTTNAFDAAIPSSSSLFQEWTDTILPLGSGTYFAPRGSTTISSTGYNCLGDLDASQVAAGELPGYLTVSFATGIGNGLGADFAVFENGFSFGSPNGLFMELAYVEVSSNGTDFARFSSISTNTGPVAGSGAFSGYDTSNVFNLAGKHASGYGTPFDLDDLLADGLVQTGLLDLNDIQYVRLVDIPGTGDFLDSLGNSILDNWLTSGTGGFDFRLPAGQGIGVINVAASSVPEPASLAIWACGALGACVVGSRRRKKAFRI